MLRYSPVVFFAYNRPEHTRRALQALSATPEAPQTCLYVYIDGPKADADSHLLSHVDAVRNLVRKRQWCGEVHVIESPDNKGLAQSIIEGVTEVVNRHGRVIVLEDDLVCSRSFLAFMNQFLELYQNDDRVISATGYVYPVKFDLPEAFFLRGADCWGWATWKRGWDLFEADGQKLLNELKRNDRCLDFDFDGSYKYTQMLRDQIHGLNLSWAIRWYASAFLKDKFTLYPWRSLIQNIGNDGSGRHSGASERWDVELCNEQLDMNNLEIIESCCARQAFVDYFNRNRYKSRAARIKNKLRFWRRI